MTDSASDPNVEDVLSSVRRLVSGEIPRKTRAPVPKGPGALVLTDADRVKRDPPSQRAGRSLEQRIAELEAAVDDTDSEFEPDGSEDQAQNVPDRIVYTRPPSTEEQSKMRRLSEIALIQTEPVDEDVEDVGAAVAFRHDRKTAGEAQSDVAKIGHNGAPTETAEPTSKAPDVDDAPMILDAPTVPPKRADVKVFSNPDDVLERIEARLDRGEDPKAEAPIAVVSTPDVADTDADAQENMLREDVVSQDEPAPEEKDEFDAALSAAVEASVAAVVFEELAPETSEDDAVEDEAPEQPQDVVKAADVAMPDKDALRKLVAELMREELQGELGERITRNVRKLVRREIKRALTARDLL